jgi:hypothetical protein
MNPKIINSATVKQFGFGAVINLETRQLVFSTAGLTIFEAGGAAQVQGICFEVIDPAGATILEVDFTAPHIDTAANENSYTLQLTSSAALFGNYLVKGVLKDADGVLHEVVLPPKDVKMPKGYDATCMVPGSFKQVVDCLKPFIRLAETTLLVYQGREPALTPVVSGALYYPRGTISQAAFSATPFQTRAVYTGDYVLRNKTTAQYHLGDEFYVQVSYATTLNFDVTCLDRLCDILCCVSDTYREMQENFGNAKGDRAKALLDRIAIPLMQASLAERCGRDASEYVAIIRKTLDCSCACGDGGPRLIQPSVVGGSGNTYTFIGQAATTVTEDVSDNVTVHTKFVNVLKGLTNDAAFSIRKVEDADNVNWVISFDYKALAQTVLTTIGNNQSLLNLLNSLIASTGIQGAIAGLDGKCVVDTLHFDYSLQTRMTLASEIDSITIGGTTYARPGGIGMNEDDLETWLNGLGLGDYSVSIAAMPGPVSPLAPKNFTFTSLQNTESVQWLTVRFDSEGVLSAPTNVPFQKTSKTLLQVLQATVDYICALSSLQVKLGRSDLRTCALQGGAAWSYTLFGPDTPLGNYLFALSQAHCQLVQDIISLPKVDCASLRTIYAPRPALGLTPQSLLHGDKAGQCASFTLRELVYGIIDVIQTDQDVKNKFCAIDCLVPVPNVCSEIESVTMTTEVV